MLSRQSEALFVASLVGLSYSIVSAQEVTTSYGIDFVTVGDTGNRDSTLEETAFGIPSLHTPRGGVDYEFRIGRTEITTGQWFEFVQAYQPYYDSPVVSGGDDFTSPGIEFAFPSGEPVMLIPPDRPARVAWQYAARYANWLHNDKVTDQWAFESGAYDTSTWVEGPNGEPPEDPQIFASPDARYRLPTPDEWTKTVYYDPDRLGDGVGGYWKYPYASDVPLESSNPGEGGLTDVDVLFPFDDVDIYLPVGSFPHANAPWGALDVSGSVPEYLEGVDEMPNFVGVAISQRYGKGASQDSLDFGLSFRTDNSAVNGSGGGGFRLVSVVPGPSTMCTGVVFAFYCLRRTRQCSRLITPSIDSCPFS